MNNHRKVQAAIAVAILGALYAAGWLWPLVRITLSLCGVALLFLTLFLTAKLAVRKRKRNAEQPALSRPDIMPVLGAALGAFLALLFLAVVPTSDPENEASRHTITHEASKKEPEATASANRSEPRRSEPSRSEPSRSEPSRRLRAESEVDPASQAAAEFLEALLGAGAEQHRQQQADPRYQRFKQSLENASVCPRCGGAGVYRYVDGSGVLQSRACPSCYGSGRAQ